LYARLDYPGGAHEFDEILAFYQIEEEDRKKRQQADELQRQVEERARQRASGFGRR
jgi:hypothetical protein